MSQLTRKEGTEIPEKAAGGATREADAPDTHVPEEAENFEHILRRLVTEKQKARKGKFGMYR